MDEVLPAALAEVGRQKIDQALKTGKVQTWEYDFERSGEPRHLEARLVAYGHAEVLVMVRDVTEQKATERALKDNQQFLQALIDEMPAPINVKDRERRFVLLNRAIADWFEIDDRQKLIGKRAEECGMVNADLYAKADKRVLRTGEEGKNVEYRFPSESGLGTWLETKSPIKDEDGTVQYIVTISLDISERKLAEEALQASEARFEALARSSPVGIFETDADLNGTLLNARWSEITGLSEEDALAQGWRKAIHPADRRRVAKEWREAVRTREPVHTEYRYMTPQGETTWCLVNAVWLRDEAGEVTGCVGTTTDITELKAAEEALQESETRLQSVAENIPGTMYQRVLEQNGSLHYTYMSSGARELYGVDAEEIVKDASALVASFGTESSDRFMCALEESAKNLTPLNLESWLTLDTGEKRWMTTRSRPRRIGNGAVAWDGVAIDETDRKLAEDRARQHEAELARVLRLSTMAEMAGALAHQLNQPLAAIANYADGSLRRLKSGKGNSKNLIPILEKTSEQAQRAGQLVRGIGEFIHSRNPRTSVVEIVPRQRLWDKLR